MNYLDRFLQKRRWSIYVALVAWGFSGFMAQPTIASLVCHGLIIPLMLMLVRFLAHHEGRRAV
jgi:hypothetical protein